MRSSAACGKAISAFLTLCQIGFAVGVIVVTATKLYQAPTLSGRAATAAAASGSDLLTSDACFIGVPASYTFGNGWSLDNRSLCYGAFGWAGTSIALTLLVALFLLCTCDCCCIGGAWIHLLFGICGSVGWGVFGGYYTSQVNKANSQGIPHKGDRTTLLVLTWLTFASFVLMTVARLFEGCTSCCGSSSSSHAAQQPPVVVVQPPAGGSYYAAAAPPQQYPPQGQFMSTAYPAPPSDKLYDKV